MAGLRVVSVAGFGGAERLRDTFVHGRGMDLHTPLDFRDEFRSLSASPRQPQIRDGAGALDAGAGYGSS